MARRKNYINRIHIMIEFAALAVWLASMILAILGALTLEGEVPFSDEIAKNISGLRFFAAH